MYIPFSSPAARYDGAATTTTWTSATTVPGVENWSSLIGIVTAICGNILISFALNTQRYAHIKLGRAHDELEEKRKHERTWRKKTKNYGTQQAAIAEERSDANAKSEPTEYTLEEAEENGETVPLIPSVDSAHSMSSDEESGEDADESGKLQNYLKSPIWWAGIVMMTLGEAGNFLAYGFAPASIVSPLGVVALVSNCLIAPWLLQERFRWRDGMGVVIAVAGCVTVVLSASDSNPRLTPNKIWHLITRWEFELYLGITVVLMIVLAIASNRFGHRTILIDLGLVGLFGGYTALSTKGVASLLSNAIWRVVTFPITYLLVAVLIFTAVMQIKYVNRALQRFNATMVIPTQFVLFTLSVIIGSAILYRDFERTTTEQAAKFVGGCALTFLGVWFITSGRNDDSGEDEKMDEEDHAIDLTDEEGLQPEIREREDGSGRRHSLIAGVSGSASEVRRPSVTVEEPDLDNQAVDLAPANAAAIHAGSGDDMHKASQSSSRTALKPPPMHATTSTPTLPTIGSSRPRTPMRRGATEAVINSQPNLENQSKTPTARRGSTQQLDPNETFRNPNRRSIAGLLPGPYTSPLSSSLSAIVADSLRRGVDQRPVGSMRRRSTKARRQEAIRGSPSKRPPIATAGTSQQQTRASSDVDVENEASTNLSTSAGDPAGRMRSFSASLGDLFGSGKTRKSSTGDTERGQ